MNELNLKQAGIKTYRVQGYNVDINFVYDADNIYIEQSSLINQMPDKPVAKNKFRRLDKKFSVKLWKSGAKEHGNNQLLTLFAGTRQNSLRLNNVEGTITILTRFKEALAEKIISTIKQRLSNLQRLQTKLANKYAPDASKPEKEIRPMIVAKLHKPNGDETVFDDNVPAAKKIEFLQSSINQKDERIKELKSENSKLKSQVVISDREYRKLMDEYNDRNSELFSIKNAWFGKRLAAVFTGWGV